MKVALSHAEHIAEDVGAEWRALGRKLGFTDGQCDCFQNDYQVRSLSFLLLIFFWSVCMNIPNLESVYPPHLSNVDICLQ